VIESDDDDHYGESSEGDKTVQFPRLNGCCEAFQSFLKLFDCWLLSSCHHASENMILLIILILDLTSTTIIITTIIVSMHHLHYEPDHQRILDNAPRCLK